MRLEYLSLNSRDRTTGSVASAIFQFDDVLYLPKGAEIFVKQFTIPMTNYTVVTGINDVIPSDLGNTTLTQGVYNITELLAHIATAMSTATSTTITCTVSNYTVTIASTGEPTLAWTSSTHSAARLLGFDPDTDNAAGDSHTATAPYDLSRPHFLHITLKEIPFNNIWDSHTGSALAHFSIPVMVATGEVLTFAPLGVVLQPIVVTNPIQVKRLTVHVRDEENQDVMRSDWTLELRIRTPTVSV